MKMLPVQPSADLVTRTDTHAETIVLRCETARLSADLRTDFKRKFTNLRASAQRLMTRHSRGKRRRRCHCARHEDTVATRLANLRV